jgi:xanthine dehydrogenase YagT iron-sulfur-binding subunit
VERTQSDMWVDVSMTVNGSLRTLRVEPRTTLLDALRDELALTGPKKSCDRGNAGRAQSTSKAGGFCLV